MSMHPAPLACFYSATLACFCSAVDTGAENAWNAWQYTDQSGRRRPLSDLRDQSKIIRRF
jgi:hypothetical protein